MSPPARDRVHSWLKREIIGAVAVAEDSAARGGALAKAAIIAGSTDGEALLQTANVKAWMITADHVHVQESDQ